VGKTTTVAKIAAQERARKGQRIGLVSADGYRVGAVEQLRLYADIIGTKFIAARTPGELEFALASSGRPLLVDTAGRTPGDRTIRELFELLAGRAGVRTHLVMPATSTVRDLERVFDGYESAKPDRVVLTRIDEAESLSPLVGVLRDRQIPISYLSTGQRVPEDLSRATASRLAACVLGEAESHA
jgi:flagellar biosynthesis protein FlhF